MNARVAVIIPTRNRRALLARALESVFRQTYRDLVAVVVNDGSTDDTRTFLDQMARQEPRLIVHHMATSTGAPSARNYAIANTDAEFVTGLDDDDEFLPDRIEFLIRSWNASGNDRDLISCLFTESVMTDGVHASVTVDRKDIVSYRDLFTHNFIGNQIFCPRERVLSVGGYDPALPAWQDLEMFMRLVRRYGPARRVHAPTYVCHVDRRPDRISANAESLRRAFEIIAGKHARVPDHLHHQLFMQIFSAFYGTKPMIGDWARLLNWRASPTLMLKMLKSDLRYRVHALRRVRAI